MDHAPKQTLQSARKVPNPWRTHACRYLACGFVPLAFLAAASGCADPGSSAGVHVTIGGIGDPQHPEGAFVPFIDGGDTTLVQGPQGGFHVWMKFRTDGGPRVFYVVRRAFRVADEELVLRLTNEIDVGPPGEAGYWELPSAMQMYMCPSLPGVSILDVPIRFRIDVSDGSGQTRGSAEIKLVPHCPTEADELSYCKSICAG